MTTLENHFTVFIRLPFERGDFVDPPPVAWNQSKEKDLWDIISRQPKSSELNWKELAERFQVTQAFLLQQVAWLYERQLSQVRAQMRKVGSRQSTTPSPAIGSISSSGLAGHAMKRDSSGGSRVPSRLSTQTKEVAAAKGETSVPGTPDKINGEIEHADIFSTLILLAAPTLKLGLKADRSRSRSRSTTEQRASLIASRRGSKDTRGKVIDAQSRVFQQPFTQSPKEIPVSSSSSEASEDDEPTKSILTRRANLSAGRHKFQPGRKRRQSRPDDAIEDEEEDESSPYLPFAASSGTHHHVTDPGATLRDGLPSQSHLHRPAQSRRSTIDRPVAKDKAPPLQPLTSSASSSSSGPTGPRATAGRSQQPANTRRNDARSGAHLEPRRAAELAAAGLSPLRRPGGAKEGSDDSPSIGSSFSDLDETSVTQSAMEEALMSNMQHGRGVTSRMSTISHALRSRVFDQRGG